VSATIWGGGKKEKVALVGFTRDKLDYSVGFSKTTFSVKEVSQMEWLGIWLDRILGKYEWYKNLKKLVVNAVIVAETTGETGTEKRQKAIDGVQEALHSMGSKLPLSDSIEDWIIGLMIDAIVFVLNSKYGKDWLTKVKEIVTGGGEA
jgi:hypothetical protein